MKNHRPKHVVMLCARHHPLDGRVFHLEACALRDAGYHVTIIAPNPGGKPEEFVEDGIRIRTFQKRWSGLARKFWTQYILCKMAIEEQADVYHAQEVDAALFAGSFAKSWHIRRGRWVKLVFDVHEVWPYFYAASVRNRFLRRLIVHGVLEYEHWMLRRHVDLVITAHIMEMHYYRWQNPFLAIRHVPSAPEVLETIPNRSGPIRTLGHEGFFTLNRGMDIILDAFAKLADEFPELILQTAGDFSNDKDRQWFDRWAERTGLREKVRLSGWVQRSELPDLLKRMDIGIVALREDEHSSRIWPANKLQNYTGYGITPVLCASMPYARQKIEERNMGRVVPFDAEKLYHAVREMILNPDQTREMGMNAWKHAREHWNWETYRLELLRGYDDLSRSTYRPKHTVTLQG